MFSEFYANSNLLIWPLVGLGIFVLAFLAVLAWVVFGLRRNPIVDRMAALPLDDEITVEERGRHD